jgi:hypothetical protein
MRKMQDKMVAGVLKKQRETEKYYEKRNMK